MVQPKTPKKPFFSLIIPTLNEEECLPHLLEDIQQQSYTDLEIIVVDGKSEDKTVPLAQSFPKTTVIRAPKRNVGYQRNLGASKSNGTWLIFFDADTRIPKYFLEGVKYRCSLEPCDVFTTWMKVDSEKQPDKAISTFINFVMESTKTLPTPSAYGAMLGCKRTVFQKVGGFDESVPFGEDGELVRRFMKHGYSYTLFRDPQFVYSLRRFRKEGILKTIQQTSLLNLDVLLGEKTRRSKDIYPMSGGSYYTEKHAHPLVNRFQEFSREAKQVRVNKLPDFIRKIFSE